MFRFHLNGQDYKTNFDAEKYLKGPITLGLTLSKNKNNIPYYDINLVDSNKNIEPVLKKYSNVTIHNERDIRKIVDNISNPPIFLCAHTNSYHHFLIDTIGGILYLKKNLINNFNIKNVMQSTGWKNLEEYKKTFIKPFHQQLFDYFNLGNYEESIVDITDQQELKFDEVITINHPSATLDSFYLILNNLRNSVLETREQNRKIYISRKNISSDNKSRGIQDEHLIQNYLLLYGYETIYFEEMTFEQQIETVLSASHIITYNGSSLVNTLFCQSGTQIIEIRNSVLQQHDAYMFWSDWFDRKHYVVECFGSSSAQEIIDALEFDDQIIL